MWTRKDLKDRAKDLLRQIYWKAFFISLVIALVTGGGSGSSYSNNSRYDPYFVSPAIIAIIALFALGASVVGICLRIFLGFPLEVGGRRFFVQSAQYYDNRQCFRFAFRSGNYSKIVITMLLKAIYNFLWFLLLIIPGIVKYYAYSMVPFILADNPGIGHNKAIELSKQMTYGHKFDMFVLDLSFLGWYILGLMAFVIGTLFVLPYHDATKAELYLVLRQNALEQGMCEYEDLGLIPPAY